MPSPPTVSCLHPELGEDSVSGSRKNVRSDPGQYQRFLEAARELGCEENMGRLDEALRRVAKAPPQPKHDPRRPKTQDRPED
jgi:hypothetical protein